MSVRVCVCGRESTCGADDFESSAEFFVIVFGESGRVDRVHVMQLDAEREEVLRVIARERERVECECEREGVDCECVRGRGS